MKEPKEKAKELVDKYNEIIYPIINITKSKQCALICVDEIMKVNRDDFNIPFEYQDYCRSVKQEIELLK